MSFLSVNIYLTYLRDLGLFGLCTSSIDNTDGTGQALMELAAASGVALVVNENVRPSDLVVHVAELLGQDVLRFAFSAGADFGLVGTLRGEWTTARAEAELGHSLMMIGRVKTGDGVAIETNAGIKALEFNGWNYLL
jgi:thiamine monophosphate kinase